MGVHDSLEKIRRPRVQIKFDVELGDAVPDNEIPFVVGVMGDFSGDPTGEVKYLADREFVNVDRDNLDRVLKGMTPGLTLSVKNTIDDDDSEILVRLKFESMKDFDPGNVAQQVEPINKLLEKRAILSELLTKTELSPDLEKLLNQILQESEYQEALAAELRLGDSTPQEKHAETTPQEESLLDKVIKQIKQTEAPHAKRLISELIRDVIDGEVKFDKTAVRVIAARINNVDEVVSTQLAEVMHHEKFQKLEGSWRGLSFLVTNSPTGDFVKIDVLNCDKETLRRDLEDAIEFDQSEIFKKVYRDRFGPSGGTPLSAMIGDYEFTKSNDDVEMLRNISSFSAAAFCPFISAASADLFGFDNWMDLPKPRDIGKIFESEKYIKWNSYRATDDSRFVTLTLPRYMSRLPWGSLTKPWNEKFKFEEVEVGKDTSGNPVAKPIPHDQYCWSNTAYIVGARLTASFFKYGWPLAFRGKEGGGLVEDLPAHLVETPDGDLDMKCPTEVPIDDRREYELSNQGFMPLGHYLNTDYAVFFGGQSTRKPQMYDSEEATRNERVCARLPYILAASRFSHYLKILARDKIRSGMQLSEVQTFLDRWIGKYVIKDPNPTKESMARLPLKEVKVTLSEDRDNPGAYHAVFHLQPFMHLEELTASIRMVARIPESG